jgi:hypothetical protein
MIKFTGLSFIEILKGVVGVLTLGLYMPSWDVDYLFFMWRFDKKFWED